MKSLRKENPALAVSIIGILAGICLSGVFTPVVQNWLGITSNNKETPISEKPEDGDIGDTSTTPCLDIKNPVNMGDTIRPDGGVCIKTNAGTTVLPQNPVVPDFERDFPLN